MSGQLRILASMNPKEASKDHHKLHKYMPECHNTSSIILEHLNTSCRLSYTDGSEVKSRIFDLPFFQNFGCRNEGVNVIGLD
jgi:hypothetical protein